MRSYLVLLLALLGMPLAISAQSMQEAVDLYNTAVQTHQTDFKGAIDKLKQCVEKCDAIATDESADLKGKAQKLLPQVHFGYARHFTTQKKFAEAIEQMELAKSTAAVVGDKATIEKTDRIIPRIYYTEGLNAIKAANYARAAELMQKTINVDDRNLDAFVGLALAQDSLKQYDEMLSTVEKGLEMAKQTNNAARELDLQGMAIAHLKMQGLKSQEAKQTDAAIAIYERAIKIDPREAEIYGALVMCYNAKSDHAKVIEYTNLAIENAPGTMDKTQFYFLKAKSLAATGNKNDACEAYKEAAHGAYKEAAEHEMKVTLKCK